MNDVYDSQGTHLGEGNSERNESLVRVQGMGDRPVSRAAVLLTAGASSSAAVARPIVADADYYTAK